MKIVKTTVTTDGVEVVVKRDDGTEYSTMLLPKENEVLLTFSGTGYNTLVPKVRAANQVTITIQ